MLRNSNSSGPCRLCLNVRELCVSHSELPAGVFKKLRNPSYPNPNPIMLTATHSVPTSKQPTARLFCSDCEQRLNHNGEKWVLENCYQPDSSFPLLNALMTRQVGTANGILVCSATDQVPRLAYFAASIFWRVSIFRLPFDKSERRVNLGREYEEAFRKYLIGLADFPDHAYLTVSLSPAPTAWMNIAWLPTGEKFQGGYIWRFVIPGIIFDLFVGKAVPRALLSLCIVRSPAKVVFLTDKADRRMCEAVLNLMQPQK
jgi:hypothetical protein